MLYTHDSFTRQYANFVELLLIKTLLLNIAQHKIKKYMFIYLYIYIYIFLIVIFESEFLKLLIF